MRALVYQGPREVKVQDMPDAKIERPTDVLVRITTTNICGSDLHMYEGRTSMPPGRILGHENLGEVIELGSAVGNLRIGDRVVVPFTISCGQCWFCQRQLFACCDITNPESTRHIQEKMMGHATGGFYGYSHMVGGYPGGQAEYLRVPHADVGCLKIESDLADEQVLFLSDIFPTGYMAAENAEIEPGDTVAVWGCGPVGQFCIQSAWMLGAGRVIAIDRVPE